MPFVVVSEKPASFGRYEKVGRLKPGADGKIEVIRDGSGVISIVPVRDVTFVLNGLSVEGLSLSESGKRIGISGIDGEEYFVLAKQVRGMIRDWPKKKAALFLRE